MADPQKPKPNSFWCPKCRAHGPSERKTETRQTDRGSTSVTAYYCKGCGSKGGKPLDRRNSAYRFCKVWLLVGLASEVCVLIYGLYIAKGISLWATYMTCLTVFIGLLVFCLAKVGMDILLWHQWKKWAEERGWEEEKPYGK